MVDKADKIPPLTEHAVETEINKIKHIIKKWNLCYKGKNREGKTTEVTQFGS